MLYRVKNSMEITVLQIMLHNPTSDEINKNKKHLLLIIFFHKKVEL